MAKDIWKKVGKLADVTQLGQLLFGQPVMIGLSSIFGAMAQSQPFISSLGWFGMTLVALLCFGFLSFCMWMQSKYKKKRPIESTSDGVVYGFFAWRGWKWIVGVTLLFVAFFVADSRPNLPPGIRNKSIDLPIASYREMKQRVIKGRTVILSEIPRSYESPYLIQDKVFEHCYIIGPVVVYPVGCLFEQVSFGTVLGAEEVLLETKSKLAGNRPMPGILDLKNCVFKQCKLNAITLAGNSEFLDTIRKVPNRETGK